MDIKLGYSCEDSTSALILKFYILKQWLCKETNGYYLFKKMLFLYKEAYAKICLVKLLTHRPTSKLITHRKRSWFAINYNYTIPNTN